MPDPIDDYLNRFSPDIQAISRELRAIALRCMPGSHEVLFAAQEHFAYGLSDSTSDRICYICPMKSYVRLGFMSGAQLADPNRLLEGEGKRLRHVKVRTIEATRDPALEHLIAAAWTAAPASMASIRTLRRTPTI